MTPTPPRPPRFRQLVVTALPSWPDGVLVLGLSAAGEVWVFQWGPDAGWTPLLAGPKPTGRPR